MAIGIEKVQTDPALSSKSKYSATVTDNNAEVTSYLDFDSYLKLLVAQMSNQDFNNPMSDSEFIAQMASYSTLEAIKNMTNQSNIQYASGLTGKAVTVSDGTNFEMGIVDSVIVTDGKPKFMINGTAYDTTKLTDVVSDTLYMIMESLKGTEVAYDTISMSGKGIVTGGLVANGDQYLIIDGDKVIPLTGITLPTGENAGDAIGEAEKNGETDLGVGGVEGTGGTGGVEGTGGTGGVEGTGDEEAQAAAGGEGNTGVAGDTDTDQVNGESTPAIDALLAKAPLADDMPLGVIGGHYLNSDTVEETRTYSVDNLSAPAFADNDTLTPLTEAGLQTLLNELSTNRQALRDPVTGVISLDDYLYGSGQTTRQDEDDDIILTDDDELDGVGNTGNTSSTSGTKTVSDAERFNSPYANTIYTNTNPGITMSDSPYYRKYAYEYPSEAALADAYGTRMFDIRFITNTAINDRILKGEVIGHSAAGKPITEIGYSGKGQLGEVNTYADGTQRVEIIFTNGKCGWYYTSGRYTISQIIDRRNWIGDLTQSESDIRHYAAQYSTGEVAAMNEFEQYIRQIM